MSTTHDVAVVGGGPAGCATATLLARAGARVLLLERARFPRPKPCAEYLSPAANRILDRLGVLGAIEGHGPAHLTGMRIVSANGTAFTGRFPPGTQGLALPREHLDAVLLTQAARAGVEVREETPVNGFTRGPDGALTVWSGPHRRHAPRAEGRVPVLVAADGLNSRVTIRLGLARRGRRRWLAVVTHATGVAGMGDVGEMHVTDGAYVGLAPVGGGLTNVAAVIRLDRSTVRGPPAVRLQAAIAHLPEVRDRLARARFATPARAVGPFARSTRRASADGVLLVGDAADFYDPFTGEGIWAALRGGELAARHVAGALATGRFGRAALAGYDRERRRVFGGKWVVERLIGAAVARPALLNRSAARLARRPALADMLVGVTGDCLPATQMLHPATLWRFVA